MSFDFKNATKEELQTEYNRIAKEMGDDQFFTKKELHFLPEVLKDGEQVLAFSSGLMDGNTWLITLTERRIIFLDKGMIYGLKQTAIPLDKINAISGKTGMILGEIVITDGAKERKISNVQKKTVKIFTNRIENAIDDYKKSQIQPAVQAVANDDPYAKLEKLASLKEKGIITEEEFQSEKKKLLDY